MDVTDSSDYWPDIQQSLEAAGVAPHLMCPISAVTGQGVLDLIRMVHTALDDLPTEVETFWLGNDIRFRLLLPAYESLPASSCLSAV